MTTQKQYEKKREALEAEIVRVNEDYRRTIQPLYIELLMLTIDHDLKRNNP